MSLDKQPMNQNVLKLELNWEEDLQTQNLQENWVSKTNDEVLKGKIV